MHVGRFKPGNVDLAVAWAAALLFDATVFSLTVYRVLKVGEKCKGSLFSLLLRDGKRRRV